MKVNCLHDGLVSISELHLNPHNANKHPPEQIQRLAKILAYQGWRYPVKVSKNSGFVTAGHGRIEAAKLNGWNSVPVNYQEYENADMEYADLIADNSIASWSELDLGEVNLHLPELDGINFDMDMLAIKDFNLDVPQFDEPTEKENPKDKETDMMTCPNCNVVIEKT